METKNLDLVVLTGSLAGRRFAPVESGLRLGRSSTCEISVPDPSLSRNQCLFELRSGEVWVTDLASANGTLVNGVEMGADSRRLAPGDTVEAGDTVLSVGDPTPQVIASLPEEARSVFGVKSAPEGGGASAAPAPAPAAPVVTDVDLGFSGSAPEAPGSAAPAKKNAMRPVLWIVAAALVCIAAALVMIEPQPGGTANEDGANVTSVGGEDCSGPLVGLSFERVEADGEHILRYALEADAEGHLSVELDDVPKNNRHLKKTVMLSSEARKTLEAIFSTAEFFRLDREYAGGGSRPGTHAECSFRVVKGGRVFTVRVDDAPEPPAFTSVKDRLEAFSRNEIGIWAVQYTGEKLVSMSEEAKKTGDAKWEERDVKEGNLAAALAAYDEATVLLETVNPKPSFYGALAEARDRARQERDKRFTDRRFRADRAISLGDWSAAQAELKVVLELVPDTKDARHREASAKLLDIESRMKK